MIITNVVSIPVCVIVMSCAGIIQEHIDVIVAVLDPWISTELVQVKRKCDKIVNLCNIDRFNPHRP